MPIGRPTKLTPAVQKQIAELFFLAFTDDQVAMFTGVNVRTIHRARAGGFCQAIKRGEMARERAYRQKIWDGREGWQGAAWFFERKYPTQFAKPEVQLQINTTNQTVNQTLIISAEAAGTISHRVKESASKIDQLLKDKRSHHNGNGNSSPPEAKK